jgi:hypothetical protein
VVQIPAGPAEGPKSVSTDYHIIGGDHPAVDGPLVPRSGRSIDGQFVGAAAYRTGPQRCLLVAGNSQRRNQPTFTARRPPTS